ncbi:MAG: condensation domain-containing protein, partial [Rickettsiales bacterium]
MTCWPALRGTTTMASDNGDLESVQNNRDAVNAILRSRLNSRRRVPASPSQQRLWILNQLGADESAYNLGRAFVLLGKLKVDVLEQSMNYVLMRHEALRASFVSIDGFPFQIFGSKEQALSVRIMDCLEMSDDEMARMITEEVNRPFDLSRGPLVRALLLRKDEEKHVFIVTMHHIVTDGWSLRLFFEELSELYSAFIDGHPSPLPNLQIRYAEYWDAQRSYVDDDQLRVQLDYWMQVLGSECPTLLLPTDHQRAPRSVHRGAVHRIALSSDVARAVHELGKSESATSYMVLLTAFKALLYRYTGLCDIAIGTPVTGRKGEAAEKLIGFFVNTLVVRSSLRGELTYREALRRVRQNTLEAQDRQDVPFDRIVQHLQRSRLPGNNPFFQVMFAFQGLPPAGLRLADLEIEELNVDKARVPLELALSISSAGDGFSAVFEYSRDLFEVETIERMAGHFKTLLEGVIADPGCRLSELPL